MVTSSSCALLLPRKCLAIYSIERRSADISADARILLCYPYDKIYDMRKEFTVASSNSIHGRAQQLWQMSWNLEVGDNHIFVDKAFDNKPYRAGGFVTIEYGVNYMWAGDKSGAYIYGRY